LKDLFKTTRTLPDETLAFGIEDNAVTYRSEDDVEYEDEEAPRRGRRWISIIVVLALAATGSASAFLWRAYGNNFPTFPSFGSTPPADAGDKVIVQKDLQAFQQQITAQTQAATQLLGSQQAEIKRLSEQNRYQIQIHCGSVTSLQ
jgi:hypothetical protein